MANIQRLPIGSILHGNHEYKIISHLGKGGFGITYLAKAMIVDGNISHEIKYAIKEFYLSSCCSRDTSGNVLFALDNSTVKEYKKDFEEEAKHLKSFNNVKGIVSVNEVFEGNNTIYYVMEFLDGVSLDKRTIFDEASAKRIIVQLSLALDVLHKAKVVHHDVKPDNIILTSSEEPILIDFGLSCHYTESGNLRHKKQSFGVSDGFSPVELYAIPEHFCPQSDVYSLAATMYYMLTGQLPEKATTINLSQIKSSLQACLISSGTTEAIIHAMQKNLSERTKSVIDFVDELGENFSSMSGMQTRPIVPRLNFKKYVVIAASTLAVAVAGWELWTKVLKPVPSPAPFVCDTLELITSDSTSTSLDSTESNEIEPISSVVPSSNTESQPTSIISHEDNRPSVSQETSAQTPTKSERTEPTDKDLFEIALRKKDWKTIEKMAKQGFRPAYLPLAEHYLKSSATHHLAATYAEKGLGVDKRRAEEIIETLKSFGYYDN